MYSFSSCFFLLHRMSQEMKMFSFSSTGEKGSVNCYISRNYCYLTKLNWTWEAIAQNTGLVRLNGIEQKSNLKHSDRATNKHTNPNSIFAARALLMCMKIATSWTCCATIIVKSIKLSHVSHTANTKVKEPESEAIVVGSSMMCWKGRGA